MAGCRRLTIGSPTLVQPGDFPVRVRRRGLALRTHMRVMVISSSGEAGRRWKAPACASTPPHGLHARRYFMLPRHTITSQGFAKKTSLAVPGTGRLSAWSRYQKVLEMAWKWSGDQGHQTGWPFRTQAHAPSPAPSSTNVATTKSVTPLPGARTRNNLREPRCRVAPPGPHQHMTRPRRPPATSGIDLPGAGLPPVMAADPSATENVEPTAT